MTTKTKQPEQKQNADELRQCGINKIEWLCALEDSWQRDEAITQYAAMLARGQSIVDVNAWQ